MGEMLPEDVEPVLIERLYRAVQLSDLPRFAYLLLMTMIAHAKVGWTCDEPLESWVKRMSGRRSATVAALARLRELGFIEQPHPFESPLWQLKPFAIVRWCEAHPRAIASVENAEYSDEVEDVANHTDDEKKAAGSAFLASAPQTFIVLLDVCIASERAIRRVNAGIQQVAGGNSDPDVADTVKFPDYVHRMLDVLGVPPESKSYCRDCWLWAWEDIVDERMPIDQFIGDVILHLEERKKRT